MRPLGIEIRAGLHTDEVEVGENDVRDIAVHVAARVAAQAQGSECLVTRTVKNLVAGATSASPSAAGAKEFSDYNRSRPAVAPHRQFSVKLSPRFSHLWQRCGR